MNQHTPSDRGFFMNIEQRYLILRYIGLKAFETGDFNQLKSLIVDENFDDYQMSDEEFANHLKQQRDEARQQKDWKTADQLRDRLSMMGYRCIDRVDGSFLIR